MEEGKNGLARFFLAWQTIVNEEEKPRREAAKDRVIGFFRTYARIHREATKNTPADTGKKGG